MTINFTNTAAKSNASPTTGKTFIKQVKRTVTGILSIALLSSAMLGATVSISSAKEIAHISEKDLKGKCARSKGRFSPSGIGGVYSCVVDRADGSHVDVACDDNSCSGHTYKRADPKEVDLCARTTLGKADPIIPTLCKSKRNSGSLLQK